MIKDEAYRYRDAALGYLQERARESNDARESRGAEVDASDAEDVRIAIAVEEFADDARVALRVYKMDAAHLQAIEEMKARGLVPEEVEVEEIGPLFGFGPRDLVVPLRPGISCANEVGKRGTVGCILRQADGSRFILSANHVLARENRAKPPAAILQPTADVNPNRQVAELSDFEPLKLVGNEMDAAIAKLVIADVDPTIFNGKNIRKERKAPLMSGDRLFKFGQSTEERSGTFLSMISNIKLEMRFGDYFFDEQIEVKADAGSPFSCEGDSGALVYDQNDLAVGIVIGGNCADRTIVTPIGRLLRRFVAELA